MKRNAFTSQDDFAASLDDMDEADETSEEDLWFLPGPVAEDEDDLPPGPRADPSEPAVVDEWAQAEAELAARLARVAGRLGALDDRLARGPEGWRHRLALLEAADLSWFAGERVSADRLALWMTLRLSGVQDDPEALSRTHWAVRRLSAGPGPLEDFAGFLDRRDPENIADTAERFEDRASSWQEVMAQGAKLHPITRACMGFHLWALAGLGQYGESLEAAVTAVRIAASDGDGAVFAPLAMGGAGGLRASGVPKARLSRWLENMESGIITAMRQLDRVDQWTAQAKHIMAPLSGRTPPALRRVFAEQPMVSAPMAEVLTGASRAAVQRNLLWMEDHGLIREITGQGRFRMWVTTIAKDHRLPKFRG
jgi:hypothetical protein